MVTRTTPQNDLQLAMGPYPSKKEDMITYNNQQYLRGNMGKIMVNDGTPGVQGFNPQSYT